MIVVGSYYIHDCPAGKFWFNFYLKILIYVLFLCNRKEHPYLFNRGWSIWSTWDDSFIENAVVTTHKRNEWNGRDDSWNYWTGFSAFFNQLVSALLVYRWLLLGLPHLRAQFWQSFIQSSLQLHPLYFRFLVVECICHNRGCVGSVLLFHVCLLFNLLLWRWWMLIYADRLLV